MVEVPLKMREHNNAEVSRLQKLHTGKMKTAVGGSRHHQDCFVQVTEVRSVGSSTLWMCTDRRVACHYLVEWLCVSGTLVAVSQVVADLQKSQVADCPPLWLLLTVASTDFTLFYENLSDRPCLLYNKMQEVTVKYPVQLC